MHRTTNMWRRLQQCVGSYRGGRFWYGIERNGETNEGSNPDENRFAWIEHVPPRREPEPEPPTTCEEEATAIQLYEAFGHNAERYGLPVRFLRQVGRDYNISVDTGNRVQYNINRMTLERNVLRGACELAPGEPLGESGRIRTIYEESAHAYLDLVSDEPRFSIFIAEGDKHYQDVPTTEKGTITTDPWQVFQEAAACYVEHRASTWWRTFDQLSIYASVMMTNPDAAENLRQMNVFDNLRNNYNAQMAQVVFGYSEEGGFLGLGSEQVYIRHAMSQKMKTFLDHELLEDMIPDRFESLTSFQRLLNQAGVTLR